MAEKNISVEEAFKVLEAANIVDHFPFKYDSDAFSRIKAQSGIYTNPQPEGLSASQFERVIRCVYIYVCHTRAYTMAHAITHVQIPWRTRVRVRARAHTLSHTPFVSISLSTSLSVSLSVRQSVCLCLSECACV